MRNLFKLCSAFYYFNCSFFFASPKKETKKTRLTNFSLKFYDTFTLIFTTSFRRPFSNYREACHFEAAFVILRETQWRKIFLNVASIHPATKKRVTQPPIHNCNSVQGDSRDAESV
jgi:hypothetical protein